MRLYEQEQLMLAQPGPVSGRAEAVTPVALIPEPGKYSGKRVIMAGIWTSGFEHSFLDLENSAQTFLIWVDVDWSKVDQSMGDFSRRRDREEVAKSDQKGRISHRIVAEGSFYYRQPNLKAGISGFGHLGVSEGYFLIDRLFHFEPYEERPNQPVQPTPGSVTPRASSSTSK